MPVPDCLCYCGSSVLFEVRYCDVGVFFLLWMLLLFVSLLRVHVNYWIIFSRAVKYDIRTLIGIALHLWKSFGKPFL